MFKYKFTYKKVLLIFTVFAILFYSSTINAHALGVPTIFSYQGRLANSSGDLLGGTGTTYYFKFSIWNVATGGTQSPNQLWPVGNPGTATSTVRQGVFNVNIGDTANGYPDALNFNFNTNTDIYLQIEVSANNSSFETLSPRQRISAAPFAQMSAAVSGAGQSSFGTTTPINNSVVSIVSTSTVSTALTVQGFLNQVSNLFNVQNSSGTNLFSISATGSVGVGTAVPSRKFDVLDVNNVPQLRLSQSSTTYAELYVDSVGDAQLSSTGGNIRYQNENLWVCSGGSCGVDIPVDKGNVIVETAVIFNNKFKLKQINASSTIMYDTADNPILEFDEGQ